MGTDFNDLHQSQGLEAARTQLLAAVSADLPPAAPTDELPAEAAAPATGGAGEAMLQRYALIKGKTNVFDLHDKLIIKKSAFVVLVGKERADDWFAHPDKKLVSELDAKKWERLARMDEIERATKDNDGISPIERYVHIEGTRDIWDTLMRRRITEGALRLSLGGYFPLWLDSPNRRSVDESHLIFDPQQLSDPAIYINRFEGFPLKPVHEYIQCQGITRLISFLCNDDSVATHFLTCWLALPLQKPGTKMGTAVLMHSTMEGSGKSLLFSEVMPRLYGKHATTVGQAQLESNWSVWMAENLYTVFEEVVSRDQRYNQVGKIKHMVTGKTFRIESKFVNGWEEANFMNAVFLSNEILPWPISENDRRLFVMWPDLKLPKSLKDRVLAEINGQGVAAFYGYLLNYGLGNFGSHTEPPSNPARERLIAISRSSWQTFLYEWRFNHLGIPFSTCLSSDLYAVFIEWCSRNKEHSLSQSKFSGFLSTQIPKLSNMPWTDINRRAFGVFFLPSATLGADDPAASAPLPSSAELGKAVEHFREKAKSSGWNVSEWAHVKANYLTS